MNKPFPAMLLLWLGLWWSMAGLAGAGGPAPAPPRAQCPVCGMFVAKYPEWVAMAVWQDGHIHYFDGAKELFKFLQDTARYAPGRQAGTIAVPLVTEYYGLNRMDARQAWFVMGSDVYGPMGHELIPTASEAEAREFMADHRGQRILRFGEITPQILNTLEKMENRP